MKSEELPNGVAASLARCREPCSGRADGGCSGALVSAVSVGESMAEIGKGRFDHRIAEVRKDEFGRLYAAFDQMAQALQDAQSGSGAPQPATIGPRRTPTQPT